MLKFPISIIKWHFFSKVAKQTFWIQICLCSKNNNRSLRVVQEFVDLVWLYRSCDRVRATCYFEQTNYFNVNEFSRNMCLICTFYLVITWMNMSGKNTDLSNYYITILSGYGCEIGWFFSLCQGMGYMHVPVFSPAICMSDYHFGGKKRPATYWFI